MSIPLIYRPLGYFAPQPTFSEYNSSQDEEINRLKEDALQDMQQDPPCFQGLQKLYERQNLPICDWGRAAIEANRVVRREVLVSRPASWARLFPSADGLLREIDAIQALLADKKTDRDSFKSSLLELNVKYHAFHDAYKAESIQINPHDPLAILSKYPKTVQLYVEAFLEQLRLIPADLFDSWEKRAQTVSEKLLPVFPRLAILYLLQHPEKSIESIELFQENRQEIEALRSAYLDLDSKETLIQALRGEPVELFGTAKEIFVRIGTLCHGSLGISLEDPREQERQEVEKRNALHGVTRVVCEEIIMYFDRLKQMPAMSFPEDDEQEYRMVFLSLLKQKDLFSKVDRPEKALPLDLRPLRLDITRVYNAYHALTEEQAAEFERLFLDNDRFSDQGPLQELLRQWKEICSAWQNRALLPLRAR